MSSYSTEQQQLMKVLSKGPSSIETIKRLLPSLNCTHVIQQLINNRTVIRASGLPERYKINPAINNNKNQNQNQSGTKVTNNKSIIDATVDIISKIKQVLLSRTRPFNKPDYLNIQSLATQVEISICNCKSYLHELAQETDPIIYKETTYTPWIILHDSVQFQKLYDDDDNKVKVNVPKNIAETHVPTTQIQSVEINILEFVPLHHITQDSYNESPEVSDTNNDNTNDSDNNNNNNNNEEHTMTFDGCIDYPLPKYSNNNENNEASDEANTKQQDSMNEDQNTPDIFKEMVDQIILQSTSNNQVLNLEVLGEILQLNSSSVIELLTFMKDLGYVSNEDNKWTVNITATDKRILDQYDYFSKGFDTYDSDTIQSEESDENVSWILLRQYGFIDPFQILDMTKIKQFEMLIQILILQRQQLRGHLFSVRAAIEEAKKYILYYGLISFEPNSINFNAIKLLFNDNILKAALDELRESI